MTNQGDEITEMTGVTRVMSQGDEITEITGVTRMTKAMR